MSQKCHERKYVLYNPAILRSTTPEINPMNSVLSEILNTGTTKTADGTSTIKLHSSISTSEGQLLQRLVRQLNPTVSLEVGLAYGVSALFICDALNVRNGTQHIVIDPNQ